VNCDRVFEVDADLILFQEYLFLSLPFHVIQSVIKSYLAHSFSDRADFVYQFLLPLARPRGYPPWVETEKGMDPGVLISQSRQNIPVRFTSAAGVEFVYSSLMAVRYDSIQVADYAVVVQMAMGVE